MNAFSKKGPVWIESLGKDFDTAWHKYQNLTAWSELCLALHAMREGQIYYDLSANGVIDEAKFDVFLKLIQKYTAEMTLAKTNLVTDSIEGVKKGDAKEWTFWNDSTVFHAHLCNEDESRISVCTTDKGFGKKIISDFKPLFEKRSERPGRVHLLEASQEGIHLVDLGKGGAPFLPENYETSVAEDFEFMKTQLTAKEPNGRLFILDGPPGTGKTYFVRGLLNDVVGAVFLLIPSKQIGSLTDPGFMPAIRRLHEQEEAPIILILEDADEALLPREISNMSVISDLLNFADGIVGSIIDVRILATTNAKNVQIEPALKRKRRLGRATHIGKLSTERASAIYKRITGEDRKIANNKFTLAEVYALADGEDESTFEDISKQHNERKTGF